MTSMMNPRDNEQDYARVLDSQGGKIGDDFLAEINQDLGLALPNRNNQTFSQQDKISSISKQRDKVNLTKENNQLNIIEENETENRLDTGNRDYEM